MKRFLLSLVAVAALLVPSTASARYITYVDPYTGQVVTYWQWDDYRSGGYYGPSYGYGYGPSYGYRYYGGGSSHHSNSHHSGGHGGGHHGGGHGGGHSGGHGGGHHGGGHR